LSTAGSCAGPMIAIYFPPFLSLTPSVDKDREIGGRYAYFREIIG
jgi:hypothetical protein